MTARAAHTTMSSQKTAPEGGARVTLAIRWVFPTSRGLLTRMSDERLVLGRDDLCQVRLPGKETSRQHAEIRRDGPVHILKDLASRNGVFLNGVQIKEAPLEPNQVWRLGEWIGVTVEFAADAEAPEPVYELLAANLAGGPVLRPILDEARRAACSTLPTVILGETGTGKEGLAHAMHAWSGRKGPFIAVNCAALVPTLAEAELFGYRRGAFTGAERASPACDGTCTRSDTSCAPIGGNVQFRNELVMGQDPVTDHVLDAYGGDPWNAFINTNCCTGGMWSVTAIATGGYLITNHAFTDAAGYHLALESDGGYGLRLESVPNNSTAPKPEQTWTFTALAGGKFRMTNAALGTGYSLSAPADFVSWNFALMAATADAPAQRWVITANP